MKLNEYVSYAGHGIGIVQELKSMLNVDFIQVRILDSGLIIMVPQKGNEYIRQLMSREDALQCRIYLETNVYKSSNMNQTWNRRYKTYMEKMKSNNPIRIAEIVAELNSQEFNGKELSYGEKKLRDASRALLETEIELVLR